MTFNDPYPWGHDDRTIGQLLTDRARTAPGHVYCVFGEERIDVAAYRRRVRTTGAERTTGALQLRFPLLQKRKRPLERAFPVSARSQRSEAVEQLHADFTRRTHLCEAPERTR